MISLERSIGVLETSFSNTLSAIIKNQVDGNIHKGIAVAYSGGLDSSVLLNLSVEFARERGIPVYAFHIHHGLSQNADQWLSHCQMHSESAGAKFFAVRVNVSENQKGGLEAKARAKRYFALGQLCSENQIPLLLAAHHQDDQAETVLLQLLRGSGVAGLSGMELFNFAPTLLGNSTTLLARPLISHSKQVLENYVKRYEIQYVDDESNLDSRFARNALRHKVIPEISKVSSAYAELLSRSAQHAQSAHRMLIELATLDLKDVLSGDSLDISRIHKLSDDRIENLLRFWLSTLGVRMPSTARLTEIKNQIFGARCDAKITIAHDGLDIHRYQNKIYASNQNSNDFDTVPPVEFVWAGESSMYFSQFNGRLFFDASPYGIDVCWLKEQKLTLRHRHGGERLKLAANRPTRDLKSHFQTLKIPFWQRKILPILCINGSLVHATSVGTDAAFCQHGNAGLVNFRWLADS